MLAVGRGELFFIITERWCKLIKFNHLLKINCCSFQDTEAEIEEEVDLLMSRYVFRKTKCKSMKKKTWNKSPHTKT